MSVLDRPNAVTRAYDRGRAAEIAGQPLSACPYMPHTEDEQYQAWVAGYEESEGPRYVVALATTPAP